MIDGAWYLMAHGAEVPAELSWLTPDEREVVSRLHVARRRDDWLLGRWTAKRAVAAVLDGHPAPGSLGILAADDGAPEAFVDGTDAGLAISISHRAGCSLCVVAPAGMLIGCDLEVVEPRSELFARDYFTARELELAARWPDRDGAITLMWSAKESVLKATRDGLREDTRSVDVELAPADDWTQWGSGCAVHVPTGRKFHLHWRMEGPLGLCVASTEPQAPRPIEARPSASAGMVLGS